MSVPGKRQGPSVSESAYDVFLVEMVKYVQNQLQPSVFVLAGMDPESAENMSQTRIHEKLESIGAEAGARLTEKLSADHSFLHADPLIAIKFVCKDIWTTLFGKQVDRLQTNYKGMYLLHEGGFRWLQRLAFTDSAAYERTARPHVSVALGMVRGALEALGLNVDVKLEFDTSGPKPMCLFVINDASAAAAAASAGR